jgi:hypothetical protein
LKVVVWFLAALSLVWTMTAFGQEAVFDKPIYDPASKSYFELVRLTKAEEPEHYIPSMNWASAKAFASRRVYKGTHGRLAIVKSAATHSFILMNLRPADNTWIGLRYFCKGRKLEWVDGEVFKANDFKAWDRVWDQSAGVQCQEQGYMPVAYTSAHDGFRWIAKGGLKLYRDLLIEYPTGGP